MTKLHQLYDLHGQSPWLDNLTRGDLTGGRLRRLVAPGHPGRHLQPNHH
jgi:transaldolase